ncbi:unnamed protein product [Gongylonema pulchrum]|uniref:Uncharacterized protein n=1 Tax=Gongylonema pulchrum TaxID=637853 RepID=A0A183ERA5_9BILA|nr:unnamed protein product [Gongylonema pulchrum]
MFVIFGLIMVGLALVSMCINVVQLKLEQLFEELLVMVLEEYKQKGVPQEEMIVPSKTDLMAMWHMLRKRRRQKSAERQVGKKSSALLRIRRGRQALFEQIHRALYMVEKGTQTDSIAGGYLAVGEECTDKQSWSEVSILTPVTNPVLRIGTRYVEDIKLLLTTC